MWSCGDVDVEMCRCGDVELWRSGVVDVEMWMCGVEMWIRRFTFIKVSMPIVYWG